MAQHVRDIMTANPVTLPATESIAEAAHRMKDEDIGDVLVETNDGKLCGVVTDRDIVIRAIAEDLDPRTTVVERICSRDLATLSPDDDVDKAVEVMRQRAVRRIPVVEDGRAVGMLSIGDLAVEKDPRSALADISAAPPNE